MVRDFTQAKKEEIENVLESIDDREWKSFMAWCGGRAAGFGDWADRLGISSYTRQIDNYQNRIRELNDDVRRQVDIAFEGAAEADRGYAGIFRRHAETVREQTMLQVMQSANRTGVDIKALVHGMRPQPKGSREERLESGRRALLNHLQARGITDSTVQQEVCDLIKEEQPYMLENLYMADFCGSEDTGAAYDLIMEYYTDRKTEMTFMEYLGKYRVTDPAVQQEIYGMITEKQPSMPRDLYRAVREGSGDADGIFSAAMDYYNRHKMDITIEDLEGLDMGERMDQIQRETFVACWNKLGQMEISKDHMIAVMACIFAESRFSATNAQGYKGLYNDYEFKTSDRVGYGIFQWTIEKRKVALLDYANDTGGSVYDLETQLGYFQYEMEEGICVGLWPDFLKENNRNVAVENFWSKILISGSSILGKGNPDYEKALEEHIEYADHIEDWYVTTFQQK